MDEPGTEEESPDWGALLPAGGLIPLQPARRASPDRVNSNWDFFIFNTPAKSRDYHTKTNAKHKKKTLCI